MPSFASRSRVHTVPKVGAGGAVGPATPTSTPQPPFGGKSRIFNVQGTGGALSDDPPTAVPGVPWGAKSQVFMVLPDGTVAVICDCCGITDTFNRANQAFWGTSDYGLDYYNHPTTATSEIEDGRGVMNHDATANHDWKGLLFGGPINPFRMQVKLSMEHQSGNANGISITAGDRGETHFHNFIAAIVGVDGVAIDDPNTFRLYDTDSGGTLVGTPRDSVALTDVLSGWDDQTARDFFLSLERVWDGADEHTIRAKVWWADETEPAGWQLEYTGFSNASASHGVHLEVFTAWAASPPRPVVRFEFEDLDIEGLNNCVFDDFNREETGQWGTPTPGNGVATWDTYNDGIGGATYEHSVVNGSGRMYVSDDGSNIYSELVLTGLTKSFCIKQRFKLTTDSVDEEVAGWSLLAQYGGGTTPRYWRLGHNDAVGSGTWITLGHKFPASHADNGHLDLTATFEEGAWYWLRWECDDGSEQRIKLWKDDEAEPADWSLVTDISAAGSFTPNGYFLDLNSPSVGSGNLELLFDDLAFDACCMFDNFDREEASDWGDATPNGYTWTTEAGSDAAVSVTGGRGVIATTGSQQAEVNVIGAGPWSIGQDFVMTALMQFDWVADANRLVVFGLGYDNEIVNLALDPRSTGLVRVGVNGTTFDTDSTFDPGSGNKFHVKWQHSPATLEVSRAKVWLAGDPEPEDWLVSRSTTADDYGTDTDSFSLFVSGSSFTVYVDNIRFETCPPEE